MNIRNSGVEIIYSRNKFTVHNQLRFDILYQYIHENIISLLPEIIHIEPKYKEHILRSKILQCLHLQILYNPQINIVSVNIMVIFKAFIYLQE